MRLSTWYFELVLEFHKHFTNVNYESNSFVFSIMFDLNDIQTQSSLDNVYIVLNTLGICIESHG